MSNGEVCGSIVKMQHIRWILLQLAVLIGLCVMAGTSAMRDDGDQTVARNGFNSSMMSRWWRSKPDNNRSSSDVNAELRHYQWQLHQRQQQNQRVRSQEENRKLWSVWNGAQEKLNEENDEQETSANSTSQRETEESLALLENLVHPEEELLDEINDRQIIQAVIASMAQWNLRKLQKMQRKTDRHRSRRDEAMVCYNELGCFRDEGPFSYLDLLPAPPEEINTRFFLYTARSRDTPHPLVYNNASTIMTSPYNASLPTKVMIHGFGSSCQRIWAKEMRTALISVGDVNVICVDWENGANLPNYVRAAVNARLVGRQVSLLVTAINGMLGSKNADFHLIGFSLGAHVAGFAGSELRNVSRITGLDPAGPLFENYDPRVRLDSTDADLVDVIHSNGEKIYMGGLGAWAPMGDIDFYPNGGRMQKGCTNLFVGAVSDMIWSSAEENGRSLCNHRRAYKLFTDSVVPGCHFPAFACESYEKLLEGDCFPCVDAEQCSNMGFYADKSPGRGIMYLATREEEPFCANQYRVQLQSSTTLQPVTTQGKIELILIGANNFNETFTLTKGPDYELTSGGKLVRLIVPHPTFSPPAKVHVVYTAYQGWIYSGLTKWPIDKLVLTDSYGKSVSFCQKGMYLESGKALAITLHPGECNPAPPPSSTLTNSLINNNQTPFPSRQPLDSGPLDNEIPVLNEIRFRSLDGDTVSIGGLLPNQTAEPKSTISSITRSNATNNIYPYGNVPLALLQQQIPADIKVGGGGGNSASNGPTSSKRPSFYQWPLVGNLFGSHGRARFKSLGGNGGSGRKYEPQGQLTPPSLQQLQQGVAVQSNKESPSNSRRPFTRRNNPQQTMSVEDQTKVEYYLLRQQQLHLQQQQIRQANRLLWGNSNRSQQLSIRGQQQALANQQYYQQWVPQRQVVPPPPPPPQWRPDALVEAEITRYSTKPVVQGELSMPLDHMQQTFAQTLLNPSNQQFIERFRNQQQQNVPQLRSSMVVPGTELTTTPTLTSTGSLMVANSVPSSSTTISSSQVTLTTMTISNTMHSHSQQTSRQPEIEQASTPSDNLVVTDVEQSDNLQINNVKKANEDPGLSLATIEAATLLSVKAPPSINHRQINETTIQAVSNNLSSSAEATSTASQNTTATTLDLNDELIPTHQTISPSNVTSSITTIEDVLIPPVKDTSNAAVLWSDYSLAPDGGSSPILLSEELDPDPEQLGQARDEYWSSKAQTSRVKQQVIPSPVVAIVGSTYYPHQYAAMRPSRLQLQEHQPLYIPLNPADRQSRQLQAQYYADTTSTSIHKLAPEPVLVVVSTR